MNLVTRLLYPRHRSVPSLPAVSGTDVGEPSGSLSDRPWSRTAVRGASCRQANRTARRLAVVLVVCLQCSPGAARDARKSSVTILYPANEWVLSPMWDDTPKFLMFLPLVNCEQGSYCGEPTTALAERWEHSADYRVWTVWLRANVRWHDGVPVTAHDIKFTIDLLNHPDVRNYNAGPVDSAVVVNDMMDGCHRRGAGGLGAWSGCG